MDDLFLQNPNINEDDEDVNLFQNNSQNTIFFFVIIFISVIIVIFNIYQVFYLINLIRKAYKLLPKNIFEECYLYNGLSDLLLEFYSFFLGLDLLFLCSLPIFNVDFELFMEKYSSIFQYLNYLVFGPFTIGIIVVIIANADKLMFICVRYKPENKIFNFKLIFFIFFSSLISLLITTVGIWILNLNYFKNSLNLSPSGNYILGYFFWKYGLRNSRRYRDRINNNNFNQIINNNLIILDEQNDLNDNNVID